jgi:hypothetical protein
MSEELKARRPMRIVAAMKKPAVFLLFFLVAAPAFAQSGQQFGILIGGVKRLYSGHDKLATTSNSAGLTFEDLPIDRYRLAHGTREIFYGVQIEPAVLFKIQAGEWDTDVGVVESGLDRHTDPPTKIGDTSMPRKGKIRHADAIIDYKFTEPFGTTGIFAGLGIYRWSADGPPPDQFHDVPTASNYGYTFGVNGEFPFTKRYAFMVEGAYHWINMSSPVRYVTLSGGLRIGF